MRECGQDQGSNASQKHVLSQSEMSLTEDGWMVVTSSCGLWSGMITSPKRLMAVTHGQMLARVCRELLR